MFFNKQPESGPRKTVSKRKQFLEVAGTLSRPSSRPSSRPTSRVGSRVNSDNEESDHELGLEDADNDSDEHQRHSESGWEGQLKDTIDELNEKRTRYDTAEVCCGGLCFL